MNSTVRLVLSILRICGAQPIHESHNLLGRTVLRYASLALFVFSDIDESEMSQTIYEDGEELCCLIKYDGKKLYSPLQLKMTNNKTTRAELVLTARDLGVLTVKKLGKPTGNATREDLQRVIKNEKARKRRNSALKKLAISGVIAAQFAVIGTALYKNNKQKKKVLASTSPKPPPPKEKPQYQKPTSKQTIPPVNDSINCLKSYKCSADLNYPSNLKEKHVTGNMSYCCPADSQSPGYCRTDRAGCDKKGKNDKILTANNLEFPSLTKEQVGEEIEKRKKKYKGRSVKEGKN